jgi:hypothetical protein
MPYSITARVYTLDDPKQPVCTYKSMKKGKLGMEHTTLGELTETLSMHGQGFIQIPSFFYPIKEGLGVPFGGGE